MKKHLAIFAIFIMCLTTLNAISQTATHVQIHDHKLTSETARINPAVWSHFGGIAKHQSRSHSIPLPTLDSPIWIASNDNAIGGDTSYIPMPQTGIVADEQQIYAIATNPNAPGSSFAIAYNRFTGDLAWVTQVPPVVLESWSTPAINIEHQQLLIGVSESIIALDTNTGDQAWSTDIQGIIVNASPIVTDDLGDQDRAFITNYSFGGGTPSRLTCINVDPFDPINNPYNPGEIVWQTPLLGDSSGNTPAYATGWVYVATASGSSSQAGKIHRFDAKALAAPSPTWTFNNTINAGFYAGISIARGHLYASSYNFNGLQFNSNTVKINRHTGNLVWSVPTNRTDATPIPLPNGDVIVSGGVSTLDTDIFPFFGTLPSIEYIQDHGSSASVLWDSAIETHDDSNNNGIWDFGESFLSIGGWTHQPIALTINSTPMLLVGTLSQANLISYIDHGTDLRLIDLTKAPTDPDFVVEHYTGAGSTPAIVGSWIYTTGEAGIHAFAPPAPAQLSAQQLINRYKDGSITGERLIEQLHQLTK